MRRVCAPLGTHGAVVSNGGIAADIFKDAKSANSTLNYISAGVRSLGHLSTELLKKERQFDMLHIPYKGSAPAVTDLLGGEVPVMFSDIIAVLPHIVDRGLTCGMRTGSC